LAFKVLVDSGVGFLVGVLLNVIKDLKRVDHKNFSPTSRIFPAP
jgi:hypothetical protein